jgi:hypothetical protein
MGRLLYVVFDDSILFGSRKPSASAPYPSFCDTETKAPFLVSYNSITTDTYITSILQSLGLLIPDDGGSTHL